MAVICAQTDSEIRDCWPVVAQLRPHLKEDAFIATIRHQMAEGYRMAFVRGQQKVAGVAGFRILHNLVWGRFCYVDDLVTDDQERSKGVGAELMDWLAAFARSEKCGRLELDSGVQRHGAHRFYLRQRMWISCYHFSLEVGAGAQAASPPVPSR